MNDDIYTKFTSNQNKSVVWKLLGENGIFNSIPDSKAGIIKHEFDRKFEAIANQLTPADTLINLDKQVMREIIKDLAKYMEAPPPIYNSAQSMYKAEPMYNAAELAQIKQKKFESEFNNKKKEFDVYTPPAPPKIDFSDNLDTPLGSEMDKILADQIALREKQLNMVLSSQDKEAATKWLQNPGDEKNPIKLKIGENIDKPKKVLFALDEEDNFLSLLKKNTGAEPRASASEAVQSAAVQSAAVQSVAAQSVAAQSSAASTQAMMALLQKILDNQNEIFELLNKKIEITK